MKKRWKRGLLLILALLLLLGQNVFASGGTEWNGVAIPGSRYLGHEGITGPTLRMLQVFQLEEGESPIMPLENYTITGSKGKTYLCTPVEQAKQADFSSPVPFLVTSEDGAVGRCWLMARPAGSEEDWTEEEKQAYLDLAPEAIKVRDRLIELVGKFDDVVAHRSVEIGGYHPSYSPMISYMRNVDFLMSFLPDNEVPGYGQQEVLYTEETMRTAMKSHLESVYNRNTHLKAEQMREWLDCVLAWCDDIESDRIAEPELVSFQLGDYKGIVDGPSHVTLTIPEGANLPVATEALVGVSGSVKANWFAGSVENGQLLYRLTPYAAWTGEVYDGTSQYSFDKDLGKTWMVEIKKGDPVLQVQNLAVTIGERTWHGRIDEENNRITLTLPIGTDLASLTPVLTHTAASASIGGKAEGQPVDLSQPQKIMLKVDTYTREYELVTVTGDSAECEILSYVIDGNKGIINGDQISLTLPYGTDLTQAITDIRISEEAALTEQPEQLAYGTPLSYVVKAQNGNTRNYTVVLTEQEASDENRILRFSYGSTQGIIDQNQGTIVLEIPDGTDVTALKPNIQLSEFATVYPASGEAQDFSGEEPVSYVVTSQSGVTNTYQVKIQFVSVGENTYKASMEKLLENIIARYRTSASDDWEWMNLGFYEGIKREPSPDNLPAGLGLHSRIAKLDTSSGVAMTDFDRTIMMLTALGIDASKLDQYTTEDQPFVDKNGNVVTDLTACLYNYSGGYTINGPIFALIALDMGNYTIPDNAVWTREKLLETILNHEYGTDGFGVDMVGMLMESIGPYYNDPVYGERVKEKLNEGIDLFLGNKKAPTVDAMQPDFTFGGFGTQNSESAAQVICGLCASGIDCHTDARFRDGKGNSALTAFLDYADGEYFAHTMSTPKNPMATYQGCYTVQWYLGFLEHGGAGYPYSLYYHQQDFSRPLSTEADILSFELEGKQGVIKGNQITVELPVGTPLANLMPKLTLSDYATLDAPSLPVTFSEGVAQPFTVRAEDGVTIKTYYVTVKLVEGLQASGSYLDPDSIKLQDARILRDLEITKRTVTESDGITDILLSVSAGVDAAKLYMTGTISYGAVTQPEHIFDGKTKVNLSGWNTVVITAEDGKTTSTYRIKAEVQETASIESFAVIVDGTVYRGVIDHAAETIKVMGVPSDADVTALPTQIELSEGTNVCSPLSGVRQDFTDTVNYTVSGNGMASRTYAVDVLDAEGNHITGGSSGGNEKPDRPDKPIVTASAVINGFQVLGTDGVIDDENKLITVTLPKGTDVSHVAPVVTVGSGCSVSPVSGEIVDLRNPVVYTVTNGSETSNYTVVVVLEKTMSQQLWEEMEQEENNSITDHQVVR